jgi:hypothetical protein
VREQAILEVGHPEVRALLILIEQEHAARQALAVVHQGLDERAEEAVDVGLAHQQVQR